MSMTENKIKEFVQSLRNRVETFVNSGWAIDGLINDYTKSADTIEKLFEEIQEYRAIGTVEHIQLTFELCKGLDSMVKMYQAIGTIEELQALKENQRKCEECAGCTEWMCDCANVRDKTIDEFAEKIKEVYPFTLLELEQLDEIVKILKKEK